MILAPLILTLGIAACGYEYPYTSEQLQELQPEWIVGKVAANWLLPKETINGQTTKVCNLVTFAKMRKKRGE